MRPFLNIIKHKYFRFSATISVLLILPLILLSNQQQKDFRGRAEAATTLSFTPTSSSRSPITTNTGDSFYLDLMVSPGKNYISLLKVDIQYDSSKMSLSTQSPITINDVIFPQVIEGPVFTDGRIQVVLSVGSDLSKSITTESRALTLNFIGNSVTKNTVVSFGENTSVSSITVNDFAEENILSSTTPAYIRINSSIKKQERQ